MMRLPVISLMLVASLALAACERTPPPATPMSSEPPDPTGGLAPPLLIPGSNTPNAQEPSYEVVIASAAADHNKALARCENQPEAVRTQCEQEANAAFAEAKTSLETLRGNQE